MVFLCIASIVWSSIALHAFSNMYRLNTRAGVLPRSASSHFGNAKIEEALVKSAKVSQSVTNITS